MPDCLILGDAAVHEILIGLSKEEVKVFQQKQEEALRAFSVEEERSYQPEPGVINRPSGQKILFRPFTSPSSVGTKIVVDPAPETSKTSDGKTVEEKDGLHGVIVLCDHKGLPAGMINAEEVTGFRTSLSAIIPWTWRGHTHNIVVFGAGKQALWHIRLALMLRGDEIKTIAVVNRSQERAHALISQIKKENEQRWQSSVELTSVDPNQEKEREKLKSLLGGADTVFCTVPTYEPLFPEADLKLGDKERRLPYVSAIGSWQPKMIELDPDLLRRVANEKNAFNPNAKVSGGAVIVDDATSVSSHTGEILQSELSKNQLVELGTIVDLRRQDSPERRRMLEWLQDGLVVYKSIGVSLTDLTAGEAILEMAKKRKLGTVVTDF